MSLSDDLQREIRLRRRSGRGSALFLLAVSTTMILLSFYGAQASVFEKARATVLDVFAPVLTLTSIPTGWVDRQVETFDGFLSVRQENERLRAENAELRVWQQDAIAMRRQLSYYEAILNAQLPSPATFIDAKVIAESGGPYDEALILSAGRDNGVMPGQAVVDNGGLVGRIVTAGDNAARVLLVTDFDSRIPVYVEDVEIEGLLAGKSIGAPTLQLLEARRLGEIRQGARIVSSGAGGRLPRGLPVGEVAQVIEDQIYVSLYGNVRTPDLVRVVAYEFPAGVEDPLSVPTDEGAEGEGQEAAAAATADG